MKKIFITAGLVASAAAFAQTTGKVGVNNNSPAATLDIQPSTTNLAGTTNEGLLIPRLTAARVSAIPAASRVEGTLVYVTDAPSGALFSDTTKGYYYYDAAATKWVKVGSGTAAAPTVVSAQNGLSLNGTAVELGGSLYKNTNIDQDAFNLTTTGVGKVGIGTNAPQTKLDVDGDFLLVRGAGFNGVQQKAFLGADGANNDIELGSLTSGVTSLYIWNRPDNTLMDVSMRELYADGTVTIGTVTSNPTATEVLVRNSTTGLVGYVDKSTLAGTSTNLYTADGTLSSARTVNQNNQNLTFTTGTARTIINGTQQNNGAMYVSLAGTNQNYRTFNGTTAIALTTTDYFIVLTNPALDGALRLPNANTATGRVIYLINNAQTPLTWADQGTYPNQTPSNQGVLAANSGSGFISDGTNWLSFGR